MMYPVAGFAAAVALEFGIVDLRAELQIEPLCEMWRRRFGLCAFFISWDTSFDVLRSPSACGHAISRRGKMLSRAGPVPAAA
jgi:hypothetical protein